MKFLADENIGLSVVIPLRDLGIDIKSITEISPGIEDPNVLNLANNENRILITTDKDFGELVYLRKLTHKGIILLRLAKDSAGNKFNVLSRVLAQSNLDLENSFTVVTETKIRISQRK